MDPIEHLKKTVEDPRKFTDEVRDEVAHFENKLAEAVAAEDLSKHFIIAEHVARLKQQCADISIQLSEKDDIPEADRHRMFDRRQMYREFIKLFDGATERRKAVEAEIQDRIEYAEQLD